MDKLDMFQARFGKVDEFFWWDLKIVSADAGTQFTSREFQDECQIHGVRITLATLEHQEMNRQFGVIWRTLRTIANSLMVHAQFSEYYINLALMYTPDHILPVLKIKDLINEDGDPTTPFKLTTGIKPSILHLYVLFCPCVLQKSTAHVETQELNMLHKE